MNDLRPAGIDAKQAGVELGHPLANEQSRSRKPSSSTSQRGATNVTEKSSALLESSKVEATKMLDRHKAGLRLAGWDLDLNAMETTSSTRVTVTGSP